MRISQSRIEPKPTSLSEAIDFFAPVREDFLTGAPPPYMTQR
jgi:hypothetical protein